MKSLKIISLVLAAALLLCLAPMPYGYYTFIRFVTMVVAALWAAVFYNERKMELAVVCGAVVLLFQPFVKIALERVAWNIVDVVVAVSLIILTLNFFKKKQLTSAFLFVFYADWCNASKQFVKEIKESGLKGFTLVDVEKNEDFTSKYNIRNVPTVILEDMNHNIVRQWVGSDKTQNIVRFIKTGNYELIDSPGFFDLA